LDRRIVLLIVDLGCGGAETQLVRLARGLKARGWATHVVTLADRKSKTQFRDIEGIPTTSLGMRGRASTPITFYNLLRYLKRVKPDILLSFMFHANMLGRFAGKILGIPVVISSLRVNMEKPLRECLLRMTDSLATVTTANSELATRGFISRGIVAKERMKVVPNAIDVSLYKANEISRE
jgi:hypothetical protein